MQTTSADCASTLSVRIAGKTRRWTHRFFQNYHPELHYMRGPGPKWREKHGLPAVPREPSDTQRLNLQKVGA